jgi:hypothetical protein
MALGRSGGPGPHPHRTAYTSRASIDQALRLPLRSIRSALARMMQLRRPISILYPITRKTNFTPHSSRPAPCTLQPCPSRLVGVKGSKQPAGVRKEPVHCRAGDVDSRRRAEDHLPWSFTRRITTKYPGGEGARDHAGDGGSCVGDPESKAREPLRQIRVICRVWQKQRLSAQAQLTHAPTQWHLMRWEARMRPTESSAHTRTVCVSKGVAGMLCKYSDRIRGPGYARCAETHGALPARYAAHLPCSHCL